MARTKQTGCSLCIKRQKDNEHISMWLKTNRLVCDNETNDYILSECFKLFIDLFGYKTLLLLITKAANIKQLQLIHQIIAKQKRDFKENNKQSQNKIQLKHNKKQNNNFQWFKPLFESLPNECISYICGFLSKSNIRIFKLANRQIAIVCLEEMNKFSVGIWTPTTYLKTINYWRHNPNKRFHSLFDEWHRIYNIPLKYQMLFNTQRAQLKLMDLDNIKQNMIKYMSIQFNKRYLQYLLIDNRKIIVLSNPHNPRKFDIEIDTYQNIKDCELMILKYDNKKRYDGKNTNEFEMENTQLFLYTNTFTNELLLHYIEHKFIAIDNDDTIWYNKLKKQLNSMENYSNYPKLKLTRGKSMMPKRTIISTFEINPLHPSIRPFQIFIKKCFDGKSIALDVNKNDQIIEIKQKIYEKTGIYISKQILTFNAKLLNDTNTANFYSIQKESTLYLRMRSISLI